MNTISIISFVVAALLLIVYLLGRRRQAAVGKFLYLRLDEACVDDIHLAIEKRLIPEGAMRAIGKAIDHPWMPRDIENAVLFFASALAMRMTEQMEPGGVKTAMLAAAKPIAQHRAFLALGREIDLSYAPVYAAVLAETIRQNS